MEQDNQNAPPRPCSACSNPCSAGLGILIQRPARREVEDLEGATESETPVRDLVPASPQQFLADDSLKLVILLTAQMFGLPRQIVMATVLTGLPEISHLAAHNPLLLARLYAGSRRPMQTSIERFYATLAESPYLQQALLDDYRATYGGMLDSASRAAGHSAGITDGQAQGVLATLLPAVNHILGQASAGDQNEYARCLMELGG